MSKNEKEYKPFKKHFWIPFSLSLIILASGIIMTVTNQTSKGMYEGSHDKPIDFVLTGPGVITLGAILVIFMLYYKRYIK